VDYFVNIDLLNLQEFKQTTIMSLLVGRLHSALSEWKTSSIGISFPSAQINLGTRLRIHGSKQDLENLFSKDWLRPINDFIVISQLLPVPVNCRYKVVKRVQSKSNPERIYRRSVKNGKINPSQVKEILSNGKAKLLNLPYVELKSYSTGQNFKLFIEQGDSMEQPQKGDFSLYGLSNTATVPWF
jgi:CRISPR-associated endonuclease Csy4